MATPLAARCCFGIAKNVRSAVNGSFQTFSPSSIFSQRLSTSPDERDPFPHFTKPEVQTILSRITGFDMVSVAGPQLKPLQKPSYLLLTDEELKQKQAESKENLLYRLQMPPFMKERKPVTEPLVVDPDLAGFDSSKYVFVDISFGVKDMKRNVTIREPDGSLHVAAWDVKDRMNQIYNPREGRFTIKPAMFEEQHLERMISEGSFLYILDRACCQFEPNDPDYVRTTRRVYNAVNAAKAFGTLRCTRHFGPLAFYLVWYKMMDHLLVDMLNKDLVSDAKDLVQLYALVHPESPCAHSLSQLENGPAFDIVKVYIDTDCKEKAQVELSFQALQDAQGAKSSEVLT